MRLAKRLAPANENGCILWTGAKKDGGYGKIRIGDSIFAVHRLAWEIANGPIPKDLCVCHKCDVTSCCNPEHLFLGTFADNNADRRAKGLYDRRKGKIAT
jgi:hypothetical protein